MHTSWQNSAFLLILTLLVSSLISKNSNAQSWARSIGSSGNDALMNMTSDLEGNVYAIGYFSNTADFDPGVGELDKTSNGDYDIYVLKLNPEGELLWAATFGSGARDFGTSISLDGEGNVLCAGNYGNTIDFDPGPGTFELSSSGGSRDIFVLKLTSDGEFIWAKSLGGTAQEDGRCMKADNAGNVYVSGFFQGVADMDPGVDNFSLNSFGGQDIFITKLDVNGDFIWSQQMGGTSNERSFDIDVDPEGNVYTCGQFAGSTDFDPGAGSFSLTASANDAFMAKVNGLSKLEVFRMIRGRVFH